LKTNKLEFAVFILGKKNSLKTHLLKESFIIHYDILELDFEEIIDSDGNNLFERDEKLTDLKVVTIDSFQDREKDFIISCEINWYWFLGQRFSFQCRYDSNQTSSNHCVKLKKIIQTSNKKKVGSFGLPLSRFHYKC